LRLEILHIIDRRTRYLDINHKKGIFMQVAKQLATHAPSHPSNTVVNP